MTVGMIMPGTQFLAGVRVHVTLTVLIDRLYGFEAPSNHPMLPQHWRRITSVDTGAIY